MSSKKCKYWKICKYYNSLDETCVKDGGVYYDNNGKCGTHRKLSELLRI